MALYKLPIQQAPLAFVDVETTGLYIDEGDRVTEVAVLRVNPGQPAVHYSQLVNPGRPIGAKASEISGITDKLVATQPTFASIAPQVFALLDGAVVVAHSASFDVDFLSMEFCVARHPLPNVPVVDTLKLARSYFNFQQNGLQALARNLAVRKGTAHRAMGDCITTQGVFEKIIEHLAKLGYTTVSHFIEAQGVPFVFMPPQASFLPYQLEQALKTDQPIKLFYNTAHEKLKEYMVRPLWASGDFLFAQDPQTLTQHQFELTRILDIQVDFDAD